MGLTLTPQVIKVFVEWTWSWARRRFTKCFAGLNISVRINYDFFMLYMYFHELYRAVMGPELPKKNNRVHVNTHLYTPTTEKNSDVLEQLKIDIEISALPQTWKPAIDWHLTKRCELWTLDQLLISQFLFITSLTAILSPWKFTTWLPAFGVVQVEASR